MRTIAIGVALFFLIVAAASGSPQHVTQKALEAPHRVGVQQLVCPSRGRCVGIGGSYAVVERGGKWNAVKAPEPPGLGPGTAVNLGALACPAVGRCVATGLRGLQRAIVLTQTTGRRWRSAVVSLPSNARQDGGETGPAFPTLRSVSCGTAGDCAAVGYYYGSDQATHALLVVDHGGTWGDGIDVQLPPDAASPPIPDAAIGGFLSPVACPSADSCSAVGTYTTENQDGATYGAYPWVLEDTGGSWAAQGQRLQLPADAATTSDYRATGFGSPFMGFTGLSCPSAGNCTAVGGYLDHDHRPQGVFFTERNGKWSQGIKAPVPAGAIPDNDPMELDNPMGQISCAAPGNCAAIGWFFASKSLSLHGLLLVERHGTWKASGLVPPAGARAPGGLFLTSVACRPPGDCVAVGYYGGKGKTHGLFVREQGGHWGRGINAALPPNAAAANQAHTFLNAVACPSARLCLAGGYFHRIVGDARSGLLLRLRFGA